jgi:hypothetical protein
MVQSYDGDPYVTYDAAYGVNGFCVTTTYTPDPDGPGTSCPYEASPTLAFGFSFAPINLALWGPGPIELTVVERDGAWYVEPALSAVATLLADVESADSQAMNRAVEQWSARVSPDPDAWYATIDLQYYEYCTDVPAPSADASFEERKAAGRACVDNQSGESSSDGGSTTPTTTIEGGVEGDGTFSAFARCQEQVDPAAVESCLQNLSDPDALARYREERCMAAADPATVEACLQDLVDKGEIDAAVATSYRCEAASEGLAETDPDAAEEAYLQCLEDAGIGIGDEDDGPDEVPFDPPASTPSPTTTG